MRERIENIYPLIVQLLEDKQKMLKAVQAVQDGEAVQELKNKIIEQIENISSKVNKLIKDCQSVLLKNEDEVMIKQIKNFNSVIEKTIKEFKDLQEGRVEQGLLTRLGERIHLDDQEIIIILEEVSEQ